METAFANRYEKNIGTIGFDGQATLSKSCAFVAGCGGLGGFILEMLSRLGVGKLVFADGDVFQDSNLNRQLFCTESSIGKNKATVAKERIFQVNSSIETLAYTSFITQENIEEMIKGSNIVFDALDNIPSRLIFYKASQKLGLPIVHAAIGGFFGQVSIIEKTDTSLIELLSNNNGQAGLENTLGNPIFTAAATASIQVAKGIDYLLALSGDRTSNKIAKNEICFLDMQKIQIDKVKLG